MAKAAGVHPNTIRAYEDLELISPVPREENGYRRFSELHLDQVKLIRMNLKCTYLGDRISDTAYDILHLSARGMLSEALSQAEHLLIMIRKEKEQAEQAFKYLEDWAVGLETYDNTIGLQTREAAGLLNITIDMLYNWERNSLIKVPRKDNGYRIYGDYEIKRLMVIRILRQARYGSMSILRVMSHLDGGRREDLKKVIDTPEPDSDVAYLAFSDNWISTLDISLKSAEMAVTHLKDMVKKYKM